MSARLYLYAITGPRDDRNGVERGLLDAPVWALPHRDIRAVVSPVPADDPVCRAEGIDVTVANVLRHEQVVESLMAQAPVLPVRFGTVLAGAERVRAVLAARYAGFTDDLARVAGKVEMGVRVLSPLGRNDLSRYTMAECETPQEPSRDGGDRAGYRYLMARLAEHRKERASRAEATWLADRLDLTLAGYAVETRRCLLLTSALPVSTTYLVPRERVPAFIAGVECLRARLPRYRFLCSGPWPPYNFVGRLSGDGACSMNE